MKTVLMNVAVLVALVSLPALAHAEDGVPAKEAGVAAQAGNGGGAQFVDADGDGICDRKAENGGKGAMAGKGKGQGKGQGQGQGQGKGTGMGGGKMMRGAGYVDANGDGVCDHAQARTGKGK